MKRLGIYYFYDKNGIVDQYVISILTEIKKNVNKLFIISGCNIDQKSIDILNSHSDDLIIKEHANNSKAYRYALQRYVYDTPYIYDEVLLIDYLIYGPFCPLNNILNEMQHMQVDYWGIFYEGLMNGELIDQSFILLKKSVLYDKRFQNTINKKIGSGKQINQELLKYKGLTYSERYHSLYVEYKNQKQVSQFPFISKKYVLNASKKYHNNMIYHDMDLSVLINENKDNYDVNQIWDNLLRTVNLYDIHLCMNHNYILPHDTLIPVVTNQIRVALFFHIYYEGLIEYCKKYAESMPKYADIYITTSNENVKTKIINSFHDVKVNKIVVFIVQNRGRDVSSLLVGFKEYVNDYDIICFAHDKKADQSKPNIIGESFSYNCFENTLTSNEYVNNIISLFLNDSKLGMLVPPIPCHGPYYQTIAMEWQSNYTSTKKLARRLGITVDISKDKPPIAPFGTIFWFRSDALKVLFDSNLTYNDFPKEPTRVNDGTIMHSIERLYSYASQQQGYYTGWVMSDTFSKMYFTNLFYYLQDINKTTINKRFSIDEMLSDLQKRKFRFLFSLSFSKKIKFLVRKVVGFDNYYVMWNSKTKIIRMIKGRIYK